MPHERFRFNTLQDLQAKVAELELGCLSKKIIPLANTVRIGDKRTPNALAIHPMEGCDGQTDGKPDELTVRRYLRFARGGAGLLWFEATAVVPEGRANPRQLLLVQENASALAAMHEAALAAGREANGKDHTPFAVLQLTHSGRYSRPVDKPAPIIAHHDGILDRVLGIPEDYPLISDQALDALQDNYVQAARLAYRCGFDGVDIKSCHRYLVSELLAAHTRPGRYGGSFENRTRFLRDIVGRVRAEVPQLQITLRLSLYDGHPYPWGWGVNQQDVHLPDVTEPLRLIGLLQQLGVTLINVSAGNPYYTPHINRPFDTNTLGGYIPDEHPLQGVMRHVRLARSVKQAYPDLVIVATGYSWLRRYLGNAAAAVIRRGWADIVGVGREAFAYPDFARDLLTRGILDPKKVCVACSRCTQIMRDHGPAGCAMLDREVYGPIYAEGLKRH